MRFDDQIKKCAQITTNILTDAYKPKVIKLKLDKDTLKNQVYLLSFIHSLKIVLSQISGTFMLLMDYPYIRGEELPYYAKKTTWNLLHVYIDAHSQRLIDKCLGYGLR